MFQRLLFLILIECAIQLRCAGQMIEVDLLSGRPVIQIPIFTVSEGSFSVPIGLQHHGNSIKVTEGDGDCGLGWNLIADGGIYRTVRGLPDDYSGGATDLRRGWLFDNNAHTINNFVPASNDDLSNCTDEVSDYNFINGLGYLKDTEPDLFTIHAPGLSATFIFGTDGNPKLLAFQDIKIITSKNTAGQITMFTVITNQGVSYEFSLKESTTRRAEWHKINGDPSYFQTDYKFYRTKLNFISSWKLKSIKSPKGSEVSFDYSVLEDINTNKYYSIVSINNSADTIYYLNDKTDIQQLSEIRSDLFVVNFSWQENILSYFEIIDRALGDRKKYNFEYQVVSYYLYNNTSINNNEGLGHSRTRHFLKSVKQSTNCTPFPDFKFEYSNLDANSNWFRFSGHTDSRMDIWGYFNDTNPGKIPTIYFYDGQTGGERFRSEPISGSSPTSIITGDDRQVKYNTCGALTKITYPTGGSTTINYEQNKYYDQVANTEYAGPGVRVKNIVSGGGELPFGSVSPATKNFHLIRKEYDYVQSDGKSSGKLLYHPVFAFADGTNFIRSIQNLAPENEGVLYERVIEKTSGKGKIVYEFSMPGTYPAASVGDWKATSSKVTRKPGTTCIPAGNLKNGAYTFPFAPNTNYDFERGLVTRISEYAEDNTMVKEKLFTYNRNPQAFEIIKGLKFERIGDIFHFGHYEIITGTSTAIATETVRSIDELNTGNYSTSTTSYSYSSLHSLLQSISVQNSDGSIGKTKFRYAKDYASITNPKWKAARGVFALNNANQHGTLVESIETKTFGGSEVVIGSKINLFKDLGNGKIVVSEQFSLPQNSSFTESSVATSGANQILNYDSSNYLLVNKIDKYDSKGNVLSILDNKKIVISYHYGFSGSLPVATINNALANEVTYTGFETFTGFQLKATNAIPTYTSGWTGEKALVFTPSMVLQRTGLDKSTYPKYRVSCWVKANSNSDITFKILNGGSLVTSVILNYQGNGIWKYLEGFVDLSTAPSSFNLEVSSSSIVEIDDIIFIPGNASIFTQTFKPLIGITSKTDDRGNSVAFVYDDMGRLSNTYDRKRNLIEVKEYQYQEQPSPVIDASFTSSKHYNEIYLGSPVVFTAASNCSSPLSYSWKVNGVEVSTSSVLSYSFLQMGSHSVQLTITAPSGSSTTAVSFCVIPNKLNISLSAQGGNVIDKCDFSYSKTFTAQLFPSSDCSPTDVHYEWYYTDLENNWVKFSPINDQNTLIFNVVNYGGVRSYIIKCEITGTCNIIGGSCTNAVEVFGSEIISITYNNPPTPCL